MSTTLTPSCLTSAVAGGTTLSSASIVDGHPFFFRMLTSLTEHLNKSKIRNISRTKKLQKKNGYLLFDKTFTAFAKNLKDAWRFSRA
jgi:hypothetical protein